VLAALAATLLTTGCGPDPQSPTPSGDAMVREPAPTYSINRPPEITSLHFMPRRAAPGERVQAVGMARDPDGDPIRLQYTWTVAGRRVLADGPEITVPESAAGRGVQMDVQVEVIASDGESESQPMTARFPVANRPPRITSLEIETVDATGESGDEPHWLVRASVEEPDGHETRVDYEWIVNGEVVQRGSDLFARSRVRRMDEVRVRATAFDGESRSPALESASIVIGNTPPRIVSAPPGLDPSGTFQYAPQVEDDDDDSHFGFDLVEGPSGMQIDERTGELSWTPSVADVGSHPVEIAVSDSLGGRSGQKFELTVVSEPPVPAARP